ncbi:MAG: hypothetical protein SWX82_13985 [Cyanobacteriota bacterium]|nr:hypothetical protein [Cyanobacteriota bacterium]
MDFWLFIGTGHYRGLAITGSTSKFIPEQFWIFGDLILAAVGVVTFGSFAVPEPRVIETSICAEIQNNICLGTRYYRGLAIAGSTSKYVPEQFWIFGYLSKQGTIVD